MPKVAIIQQAPAVLDRAASLHKAVRWVEAAAAAGAALIVLPESFVPCYPAWIWRLRPGPDGALTAKLHARLVDNAVSVGRGDLAPLCNAAREHKVDDRLRHDRARRRLQPRYDLQHRGGYRSRRRFAQQATAS